MATNPRQFGLPKTFSHTDKGLLEMLSLEALDQNRTSFFQTVTRQFQQLFQDQFN